MMRAARTLLMLLALLPMLSTRCIKGPNTTAVPTSVEGRVLRHGDDKPLEGQLLVLSAQSKSSAWTPNTDTASNTALTDADGRFRLDFKANENYIYKLGIFRQSEKYDWNDDIVYLAAGDQKLDVIYRLAEMGTLAVHLKNAPPLDTLSSINFDRVHKSFYYISNDTLIFIPFPSGLNIYWGWWKTMRNHSSTRHSDTILIPIADTLHYTITY